MQFKKATREQAKLRLALCGPSGSGKTYTALAIATHLGQRVALARAEDVDMAVAGAGGHLERRCFVVDAVYLERDC